MLIGGGISFTASMLGGTIWNTGFKKALDWRNAISDSTIGNLKEEDFERKIPKDWEESQLIFSSGDVKNLNIDAETGTIFIAEDPSATEMKIFCNKDGGAYYLEEGQEELDIQLFREKKEDEDIKFAIFLPVNYHFQSVNMELEPADSKGFNLLEGNSGPVVIANVLSANELNIKASVAGVKIKNGNVETLSIDNEVGGVEFSGVTSGNIDAQCEVGGIKLELIGKKEDYNYDYQYDVGTIRIEDENMTALSDENWVDHGAGKEMNLECEVGAIEVDFASGSPEA